MDLPLTEKEIEFMEHYHTPTSMTENLIPVNENAPQTWNAECDCIYEYPYQVMMQNFSYLVANDSKLTPQENFNKKKGAGTLFSIGARNLGKSFYLKIDIFLSWIHGIREACVASFDQKHLSKVTDPTASYLESHPFAKIFHIKKGNTGSVNRKHGGLRAISEHGCLIESANEKVDGNNPGTDFHAKHFFSLWYEEASYMSKEGTEKRIDSGSSLGYIDRPSGIPDLRIGSPLTKVLQDKKIKRWIWRLPQMCVSEGSKILMADCSYKNIEDVNIGDEVISITEKKPFKIVKAIVENKIYNGIKDTVSISNEINSLELTPDHKIFCKINYFDKRWKKIQDFSPNYEAYSIPNITTDIKSYYEGVFLGFLESEGSFKRNGIEKSIGQKVETDALQFVLDYLNIKYTKYPDKTIENFYYFYLSTKNNPYIDSLYSKLKNDSSIQYGFLVGFILGDGGCYYRKCQDRRKRELLIVQKNKCELLEDILAKRNVRYAKYNHSHKNGMFVYNIKLLDIPLFSPYSKKGKKYSEVILGCSLIPFIRKPLIISKNIKQNKVWDLTTSSGSFIANGFVVHNCRPDWSDEMREQRIAEYNGESSSGFKLNVLAETVEGAEGFWDINRLKEKCYKPSRRVKYFEVNKESFANFRNNIIVERMPGTEQVFICSDIGYSGSPSQVIIIFKVGDKYKYAYNIPLFKLIHTEQAEVVKWLYDVLGTAYIATDATGDNGAIIDDLFKMGVPEEHLLKVFLGTNIEVGFEKDLETGKIILDNNGNPVMKKVKTIDWSMSQLEYLFYNGLMEIPQDENFFEEFNSFYVKMTGIRKSYGSSSTDHKHQSFQCFAICQFFNEFNQLRNKQKQKRCYGVI